MSAPTRARVSQKTAFLIFLPVMILAGPLLYAIFTNTVFIVSPDWWAKFATWAFIGSAAVGLLSVPVCLRFAKSCADKRQRLALIFAGPVVALSLAFVFARTSLPMVMSRISSQAISYELTVSSTQRSGKVTCDYPFSIREISETFCATSASAYRELRPGSKIEVFGEGNQWGMIVKGYRPLAR